MGNYYSTVISGNAINCFHCSMFAYKYVAPEGDGSHNV